MRTLQHKADVNTKMFISDGQKGEKSMLIALGMGRVTKDVEVKTTTAGKKVAEFSVATRDQTKKDSTNFVKVVLFDNYAMTMAPLLTQGTRIIVNGNLSIESFTRTDGSKGKEVKFISPDIQTLDKKEAQSTQDNEAQKAEECKSEVQEEKLPF